jgi:hypothetical protein
MARSYRDGLPKGSCLAQVNLAKNETCIGSANLVPDAD